MDSIYERTILTPCEPPPQAEPEDTQYCGTQLIETDNQAYLKHLKGGPLLEKRWELVRDAHACGVRTQITVSPCLPFTGVETFGQRLIQSSASRVIVDTVIDGDGTGGRRTAHSLFAKVEPDWDKTSHAHQLYDCLKKETRGTNLWVGWSIEGFCSIPPQSSLELW